MPQPSGQTLVLADDVVFTCQSCGDCCRSEWLIGVDEPAWQRLATVDWGRVDPALPAGDKFQMLPAPLPSGERRTFARVTAAAGGPACGSCVFLTEDSRCSIHRHLGYEAKPQVCREFPYTFTATPDGVAVGVSFACTAVRGRRGAPLDTQRGEIGDILAGSARVRGVPDPIVLYSGVDITWAEYRPIEAALLAVLGDASQPLARSLVAGSVLVSLCVSLAGVERNARARGQTPPETLASGLEQLAAGGYARLFRVAGGVRSPARPSLSHLAPLHAWLRLSRAPLGRLALVRSLYADYVRFRRQRGRVQDLVTGGAPIDLARVARVRFEPTPKMDELLRSYWRHAIFRKTLTPMHGVFRGYHVMLALHSFTRWAARVAALQAGRDEATLADVQEAVRLVEQRFVLHARFGDVFAVSPVLTLLADRLFGAPGFVPAAVLERAG